MEMMFSAITDSDSTNRSSARASADITDWPVWMTSLTIDCGERFDPPSAAFLDVADDARAQRAR